ncbi:MULTISPECIES: hypothetical protein [Halorussus]|uniref:hypothetical protein n=1 Tax=Halorussus TaxID=1070314 RepID=UPI00209FF24C|nr:hypothetical protein [Halorussus vallis]USZ74042.1 hypothetical protein NGM07_11300 [Halorussus vallis]
MTEATDANDGDAQITTEEIAEEALEAAIQNGASRDPVGAVGYPPAWVSVYADPDDVDDVVDAIQFVAGRIDASTETFIKTYDDIVNEIDEEYRQRVKDWENGETFTDIKPTKGEPYIPKGTVGIYVEFK